MRHFKNITLQELLDKRTSGIFAYEVYNTDDLKPVLALDHVSYRPENNNIFKQKNQLINEGDFFCFEIPGHFVFLRPDHRISRDTKQAEITDIHIFDIDAKETLRSVFDLVCRENFNHVKFLTY